MIPYIGDFVVNSTVRYFFGTNASTGASVNRTTAGSIRVYKNTSVTERTSVAGITDTSGFDSVTGLSALSIDLSNNTDAGFYAAANDYVVVLFGAVIDTQTVNVPLFQFSIENRSPALIMRNAIADSVWDEPYAGHTTAGTFGKLMDILRKSNYVTEGTVTSTVTPTIYTFSTNLTNETGAVDHQSLLFITGNHVGTSIPIIDYNQTNGLVTLEEPLHAPPSIGSEFVILGVHVHSVSGIVDAVWDELLSTHSISGSAGKFLRDLASVYTGVTGVVTSAINATYSSFSTNLTAINDTYDEQTIVFTTGNCAGQSVPITQSLQTNGFIETEDPFTSEPQPGDVFSIIPIHIHKRTQIADTLLSRLLDSSGSSNDVMNERTVRSALRAMRNKVIVNSGTMSVYKEDDSTAAWEGSLSNTADVTVNPDGGTM